MNPQKVIHFAGLDGQSDATLPEYYQTAHGVSEDDCLPFSQVIRNPPNAGGLFSAETTTVSWQFPLSGSFGQAELADLEHHAPSGLNPYYGEDGNVWVEVDYYNATYSPEKVDMWLNGHFKDDRWGFVNPLWRVSTERYGIINPGQAYAPLEDAVRDHDLGDAFYGQFRLYEGGGSWVLDGLFDTRQVSYPGGDPVKLGFTSGSDFFGNTSFFAEGYAQDTACTNSIRALTDRMTRRHTSKDGVAHVDYTQFKRWWVKLLDQIDLVSSELHKAIEEALDVTVPLPDLPFDLAEFYRLAGFKDDIAVGATYRAQSRAKDRWHPTMWDVHSGATGYMSHDWAHGESDKFREYNRLANDLLFNPSLIVDRAADEYERRQRAKSDDELLVGGDTSDGIAAVTRFSESIRERADEYEDRQDRLQTLMADAEATLQSDA